MRKVAILLSCVAAAALLPGCNALYATQGEKQVDAEYKPDKKKMLIVPFKDEAFGYFESEEGTELARNVGDYIMRKKITAVQYDRFFPQGMKEVYDRNVKENEMQAWKALAKELDCELVLVGQIQDIDLGGGRNVNVVHGRMMMSAQVFDIKDNSKIVWQMNRKTITYPEGWENEYIPDTDMPRSQLKGRLLIKGGEVVGQCFHKHMEPL